MSKLPRANGTCRSYQEIQFDGSLKASSFAESSVESFITRACMLMA